ncbi:uncharacterized protein [Parasteatoda tepidariorum]|uniref:uncharacterized protein n=1 Tax=Parasteatoda tepidariorum TaxID=114398 RepID=UPI0039BD8D5C
MAHRVFDIIGYTTTVMLLPKITLQETWNLKLSWNDEIPDNLAKRFKFWLSQLHLLEDIKVPRWLELEPSNVVFSLHLFCDDSKSAYEFYIFLRIFVNDIVKIHLVIAKSRVAPLKSLTIPRLELLVCCI